MKKYIPIAVAAITFASCTNNDTPTVDAMTDTPVTIQAGVASLMSRAGMTTNDLKTLSLTIQNTANSNYTYTDVKFENNNGAFAPAAGQPTPLWQNATQEVTVSAWSPYVENLTGSTYAFSVQANQTSDEAAAAADFLWVREEVDPDGEDQTDKKITYSNGALNIALQHAMSKLVVNVRKGTELESGVTVSSVAVKGLENACTLNFSTFQTEAPAASVKTDIIAHLETTAIAGYDNTFEAIFPPQNATFSVMVELSDGRKFLYEHTAFAFEADHAYTLGLIVGKDKVKLASAGITATAWTEDSEDSKDLATE